MAHAYDEEHLWNLVLTHLTRLEEKLNLEKSLLNIILIELEDSSLHKHLTDAGYDVKKVDKTATQQLALEMSTLLVDYVTLKKNVHFILDCRRGLGDPKEDPGIYGYFNSIKYFLVESGSKFLLQVPTPTLLGTLLKEFACGSKGTLEVISSQIFVILEKLGGDFQIPYLIDYSHLENCQNMEVVQMLESLNKKRLNLHNKQGMLVEYTVEMVECGYLDFLKNIKKSGYYKFVFCTDINKYKTTVCDREQIAKEQAMGAKAKKRGKPKAKASVTKEEQNPVEQPCFIQGVYMTQSVDRKYAAYLFDETQNYMDYKFARASRLIVVQQLPSKQVKGTKKEVEVMFFT